MGVVKVPGNPGSMNFRAILILLPLLALVAHPALHAIPMPFAPPTAADDASPQDGGKAPLPGQPCVGCKSGSEIFPAPIPRLHPLETHPTTSVTFQPPRAIPDRSLELMPERAPPHK